MLTAEHVTKQYPTRSGTLTILRDISLALARGASAVIMGPSGSGKSTLLNIIGTLDSPSSGNVKIDECDPFTLDEQALAQFRNRRIGFIFQEHHLLPQCSVIENVLLPTLAGKKNAQSVEHAHELLNQVGLKDRLDHRPGELSGGERQRAAVARALINQPALVLADEPTGNLDRKTAAAVGELLAALVQNENTALLVVTHSQELANRFQTRFELLDGALEKLSH